jgi:hypothetical protein
MVVKKKFNLFIFKILKSSQNHPQENFAMFSYKPYMDTKFLIFSLQVLESILELYHFKI